MKKNFFRATLVVAAITAVGLGSYKAYGSYTAANMSEEDLLMAENVLALSDNVPNGTVSVITSYLTCYRWENTGGTYTKNKTDVYQKQTVATTDIVNACGLIAAEDYDRNYDKLCWASTKKYSSCEEASMFTSQPSPTTREVKVN